RRHRHRHEVRVHARTSAARGARPHTVVARQAHRRSEMTDDHVDYAPTAARRVETPPRPSVRPSDLKPRPDARRHRRAIEPPTPLPQRVDELVEHGHRGHDTAPPGSRPRASIPAGATSSPCCATNDRHEGAQAAHHGPTGDSTAREPTDSNPPQPTHRRRSPIANLSASIRRASAVHSQSTARQSHDESPLSATTRATASPSSVNSNSTRPRPANRTETDKPAPSRAVHNIPAGMASTFSALAASTNCPPVVTRERGPTALSWVRASWLKTRQGSGGLG